MFKSPTFFLLSGLFAFGLFSWTAASRPPEKRTMRKQRNVWRLRKRPVGKIADGDLTYEREDIPELGDGQFLLETLYLSLDPTNRIWMSDVRQYMPPVALGEAMRAGIAGRVVASKNPGAKEGEVYFGLGEFASHVVTDGTSVTKANLPPGMPLSVGYGIFGLVGPTAYFGLLEIGQPKEGDTLVVSAASGGVGQIVGQIGKIKGCRVIGIAGGPEKCRYLTEELGFDAAIDYKNEDVGERLDALAPEGIEINFEQVGGPIMEAVMARMKRFGRMPLCGFISDYNVEKPGPGPSTFPLILMERLKVQGFLMFDYMDRFDKMFEELGGWVAEGRIKTRQDVRKGLDGGSTISSSSSPAATRASSWLRCIPARESCSWTVHKQSSLLGSQARIRNRCVICNWLQHDRQQVLKLVHSFGCQLCSHASCEGKEVLLIGIHPRKHPSL